MTSCRDVDAMMTPYVDGETTESETYVVGISFGGVRCLPRSRDGRKGSAPGGAGTG